MNGIEVLIVAEIAGDATIQALMGGDSLVTGDPRIYWYFHGDAEVTTAKPAYITYAHLASPQQMQGVGLPVYSMIIWGRDVDVVEAVRDRLVLIFDKRLVRTPDPYDVEVRGKLVHEQDSFQEQSNFAGKTLHFRFGFDTT